MTMLWDSKKGLHAHFPKSQADHCHGMVIQRQSRTSNFSKLPAQLASARKSKDPALVSLHQPQIHFHHDVKTCLPPPLTPNPNPPVIVFANILVPLTFLHTWAALALDSIFSKPSMTKTICCCLFLAFITSSSRRRFSSFTSSSFSALLSDVLVAERSLRHSFSRTRQRCLRIPFSSDGKKHKAWQCLSFKIRDRLIP